MARWINGEMHLPGILGKVARKCVAEQPELNYVMTRKLVLEC